MSKPLRALAILIAGLLVGLSVPVVAHHVNPPTEPLSDIELLIYPYPNIDLALECGDDISARIDWKFVRIEVLAFADAVPTEHWRTDVNVWSGPLGADPEWPNPRTGKAVNRLNHEWNEQWTHQNIGPHGIRARSLGKEIIQSNHYFRGAGGAFDAEGTYAVEVRILGDESGQELVERCVFERVEPGS